MRLANIIVPVLITLSSIVLFSQKGTAYTLEESFQKTLLQEGATKLSVSNRNGNIEVSPWQEDSIRIEATKKIKAANKKKAREYAEELKIEISREGNEIIVRTIRPESEERRGFWDIFRDTFNGHIQAKVDYNIRVPEKLDLDIRSRNGSIKTGGIKGNVTGETRNGGIQIDDVEGEIFARSRNGSMSLAEIAGPVDVETRNGKTSLSEITGSVKTVTRNGNIRIAQVDEDVSAHSRDGSLSLLKIGGSVNASTRNGKIWTEITGRSFQGCDLSTRNASITLLVPGSLSADLDVYSPNGKVKTELSVAVSGGLGRGKLKGKINQGGPLLRLRTRNGNIAIRKSQEVIEQ